MTNDEEPKIKNVPDSFGTVTVPFRGEVSVIEVSDVIVPSREELGVDSDKMFTCVLIPPGLKEEERNELIESQTVMAQLDWGGRVHVHVLDISGFTEFDAAQAEALISGVIVPERKSSEGTLVKSYSLMWLSIINTLQNDWTEAFKIPAYRWEEIMAGAFSRAGFDEVVLTPRSRDFGRDVIAIKHGVGSIKIINSVKAYAPGNTVKYDDVRATIGVMASELNVSKAIVSTTSSFPPRIEEDPLISALMPTRLELLDGKSLRKWLGSLIS